MSNLAYLNELRGKRGIDPLKSWKGSKQQLADLIAKLEGQLSTVPAAALAEPPMTKVVNAFAELRNTATRVADKIDKVTHVNGKGNIPEIDPAKITKCPPSPELRAITARQQEVDKVVAQRMKGDTSAQLPKALRKAATAFAKDVNAGKSPKASVKRLERAVTAKDASVVTLADIARELELDPKVARAKMRRVTVPAAYLAGKHRYHVQHKQWVVDVLRKDLRKETV